MAGFFIGRTSKIFPQDGKYIWYIWDNWDRYKYI